MIVVGCSAGALIAMKLANLYLEPVSMLILHEPPMTSFLMEDSDSRAKPKSEGVVMREALNLKFFMKNEFTHVFSGDA